SGPSASDAPRRALDALRASPGGTLLLALLLVCLYAAFADGAVGLPESARVQTAIALLSLVAAGAWLFDQGLALRAPRRAWVGIGLLGAFAVWAAISLLWSVAPDRSWGEVNRTLSYVLFAVLAVGVGSSLPRAAERLAVGWLVVAVAVSLYALGGKIAPGVNIPGLLDLNHTSDFSRLREPIGYWNALGLVCALGAPVAVRLAVDTQYTRLVRLAGLGALWVLLVTLALSYSRGGLLALGVAVIITTWLAGGRLRGLLVLALAGLATLPAVALAFLDPALADAGTELGPRILAGRRLAAVMAVCLAALLVAGWALMAFERRVRWSPRASARVWRAAAVGAVTLALLGLAGVAASDRGVGGSAQALADAFTGDAAADISSPGRLATVNSANRWGWWQEAAGAFSDRPLGGWGASSFPVVHRLYRDGPVNVAQPHSVPLQFLAETGIVGAALALGGLGLLLATALARVRSLPRGRGRDMSAALVAGGCAWLVHGLVDWDWDIPAVTLPVLAFLGVLCARRPEERTGGPPAAPTGPGGRGAALAVIAGLLCFVLASAIAPAWSQSLTQDALVASGEAATPEERADAAADAELAARIDPLAVEPLLAGATVAASRERLVDAKAMLVEAVERQPFSVRAWDALARLSIFTADRDTYARAAQRVLELDPAGATSRGLVEGSGAFIAPPALSPTATGTPLTPSFVPDAAAPGAVPAPAAPPAPPQPGPEAPPSP
ncbi:MAG TPA: O-antigen ligase family protein, partial [Solirubrobacteraceae bacterium]|nr:O-antigen ligase family protein [Solirubrobacteraceae bacterium]